MSGLCTEGQGAFGKIYHIKIRGRHIALKKVPNAFMSEEQIDREKRVYQSIAHPNVVKLMFDPWLDDDLKWNIPLEYIHGKDLENIMFGSNRRIELTTPVIVTIINGMCSGLRHLHKNNIIHQDLKPDNIMVEYHSYRPVIIDLGLAKFDRNGLFSGVEGGNRYYAAPEVAQGYKLRDKGADVWAMGKIIAELLLTPRERLPPSISAKATMEDVIKHIKRAGYKWNQQPELDFLED